MEHLFNSKHRKKYVQGYTFGVLPVFHDCKDMLQVAPHFNNEAFITGFHDGRLDYENLNGRVSDGVPQIILTEQTLEGFLLEGKVGMKLQTDGYTDHQKSFIIQYYQKGHSQYESNFDISLYQLLAVYGIGI